MSQTDVLNLVLDAVSDIVIDDLVIESKRRGSVEPRPLKVKRVATWG